MEESVEQWRSFPSLGFRGFTDLKCFRMMKYLKCIFGNKNLNEDERALGITSKRRVAKIYWSRKC